MKTYLVSEEVLKEILGGLEGLDRQIGDDWVTFSIERRLLQLKPSIKKLRAILNAPAAEPLAWMNPNEGVSYENYYVGNVPLFRKDA